MKYWIKQLAYRSFAEYGGHDIRTGDDHIVTDNINIEMFADFLLQECYLHLTNVGLDHARESLEKHFNKTVL
jgi:hypothetical protein